MGFTEFERAIKSQSLREVARHWNEARGGRAMPDWTDLKPSSIAPQLSIIWSYRYDRAEDKFTGRLAGDQVEKVFGKTFRGTPMTRLYSADQYPIIFNRFHRIVREPAFYLEEGKVFQIVDRYGFGERIAMPLSSDGTTADGVVGATVYEAFRATDAQPGADTELWFPLG
jgi:hypothetical protein